MSGTVRTSDVINLTIGRATNDDLERTVAVWFKDEDEDEQTFQPLGPIGLQVGGTVPGQRGNERPVVIDFCRGDGPEWFGKGTAKALADELGVPLIDS